MAKEDIVFDAYDGYFQVRKLRSSGNATGTTKVLYALRFSIKNDHGYGSLTLHRDGKESSVVDLIDALQKAQAEYDKK